LEEVSEACAETAGRFFQLYVCRDHEVSRRVVARAERAGYSALFFTVDLPKLGKRRAQFYTPTSMPPELQSVFNLYFTITVKNYICVSSGHNNTSL